MTPTLATSFARRTTRVMRGDQALTEDQMRESAPSIFAPDGHFKLPRLWPVKLPRAGRPNYGSVARLSAMREAASLSL